MTTTLPHLPAENSKYSVGDRVEADWKAGGEFFPGAISASRRVAALTPSTRVVSRRGF